MKIKKGNERKRSKTIIQDKSDHKEGEALR